MGGKRGNENAQMRREDYEAQLAREEADDGESPEVTQGIPRASEEQLKTRRIVRARRPPQRPQGKQKESESSANPFAKLVAPTATSTNPFVILGDHSKWSKVNIENPSFSFDTKTKEAADQPVAAAVAAATNLTAQTPPESKKSSPFDLEKAIKDSMKEIDPDMKQNTRLDAIIKAAAQQIHQWVLKNPESFTKQTETTTIVDITKDDSTPDTASPVSTKATSTEDNKSVDTN